MRVGVDLVEVDRLAAGLRRRPRLADRLFTAAELAAVGGPDALPWRLAGRLAVKEAVLKALGTGLAGLSWHDIEVRSTAGGAPCLHLAGAARQMAAKLGVTDWAVSISHTRQTAVAVVVAQQAGGGTTNAIAD